MPKHGRTPVSAGRHPCTDEGGQNMSITEQESNESNEIILALAELARFYVDKNGASMTAKARARRRVRDVLYIK